MTQHSQNGEGVERDMSGETVLGFRVAAYRETHPVDGARYGHTYSEHWSTPNTRDPRVKIERLFTEDQLRQSLAREPATAANTPPDELARLQLLADVELHLQSARIFLTMREKMHPCGVDLHDELQARVTAAINEGKQNG